MKKKRLYAQKDIAAENLLFQWSQWITPLGAVEKCITSILKIWDNFDFANPENVRFKIF